MADRKNLIKSGNQRVRPWFPLFSVFLRLPADAQAIFTGIFKAGSYALC
jgi:hypothetical protein